MGTQALKRLTLVASIALLAAADRSVAAQEDSPVAPSAEEAGAGGGVSVFPVAFYLEQGAVTALDMVQGTPGFAFRDTDNSRGYAAAAGNVLIDGRRPSSKTTQLRALLRQIPAQLVDRIEVIRAGTPGIDMQGLPLVANIIRKKGVSSTLALEGLFKGYTNGELGPTLRAEGNRRDGTSFMEGATELRRERNDEEAGDGPISRTGASGANISQGRYVADYWTERVLGSGAMERYLGSGLFRANLSFAHRNDEESDLTTQTTAAGASTREVVDENRRVRSLGLGADYDGTLGAQAGFQLLALQSLEWVTDRSLRTFGADQQAAREGAKAGESIVRGSVRWRKSPELTLEAGGEAAYNFLDANSTLTRNGIAVVLPAANVSVTELRGEVFTTLAYQPVSQLSLDLGLRAEQSRIETTGDARNRNTFSFLKPRAQLTFMPRDGTRVRVGVDREVGQLDFDDFAAGSELANDTVNAGNPDLEPERAWVYELSYEQSLFDAASVTLGYKRYSIAQVIDVVPVQGFAAPGNIGGGTRDEWSVATSIQLAAGETDLGRIQFIGTWRSSSVVDPVTAEQRRISGEKPFEGDFTYTRDFPALRGTFGVRGELTSRETQYRLDQTISERRGDLWRAYWDWRARPDLLFRFQAENLASRSLTRNRVIYSGLRSGGVVVARESRSARFDPHLTLRIRWMLR